MQCMEMEENNHIVGYPYHQNPHEMWREEKRQQLPSFLHSVRKPPAKPWRKQQPIPPMVYRVEPRGFRELVQRLTGAPPAARRPRADAAPAPPMDSAPVMAPMPVEYQLRRQEPQPWMLPVEEHGTATAAAEAIETRAVGSPGLLSPSMMTAYKLGWCTFPDILSPGTMASLEQSTVPS